MRKLERGLWALFLITALLVGGAEAQSNATIVRALNRFLNQPHTWTQVQTFLLGTATIAGTGLTVARPGGLIFTGYNTTTCSTATLTNVGTAETDLCVYSMLGGTLGVNGQKLRVTLWGVLANNANAKTLRIYLGTTQIAVLAGTTLGNVAVWQQALLLRTGAATELSNGIQIAGTALGSTINAAPTENLATTLNVRAAGTSAVTGGDVTLTAMTVEWLPQ